ncbi:MAG: hypothetical protein HGA85_05180, partial [Nanoarchaeota archaeon]|nr:hypothetical protein [Nanoarchaeota archaeon]
MRNFFMISLVLFISSCMLFPQETLYSDFVLSNDNLTVAYLKHEVSYFRENRTLNSREDLNYTY